jgi:hypothetical protein
VLSAKWRATIKTLWTLWQHGVTQRSVRLLLLLQLASRVVHQRLTRNRWLSSPRNVTSGSRRHSRNSLLKRVDSGTEQQQHQHQQRKKLALTRTASHGLRLASRGCESRQLSRVDSTLTLPLLVLGS